MQGNQYDQGINTHYGHADLEKKLLAALQKAGKNIEKLTLEDLEPVDQLHTQGKLATIELLQKAPLQTGMKVLDVGGGIGGAARYLAETQGCDVTVLDLTEEFCRVGEILTKRTGLDDVVHFQHGNALAMPFPDASFDAVLTQHSTMNIEDKLGLYRECKRVLRPGGRLAFFEIMAGPVQPMHFPVPWARDEQISFMETPQKIREMLGEVGFTEIYWEDTSKAAIAWLHERIAGMQGKEPPILGLYLMLGPSFGEMFRNIARNFEEQRVVVIQGVFGL